MRRLVWAIAGRTYHIVGNLMSGLIYGRNFNIWKILNLRNSNLKTLQYAFKVLSIWSLNGQLSLVELKINQRSYYNLPRWNWSVRNLYEVSLKIQKSEIIQKTFTMNIHSTFSLPFALCHFGGRPSLEVYISNYIYLNFAFLMV